MVQEYQGKQEGSRVTKNLYILYIDEDPYVTNIIRFKSNKKSRCPRVTEK